MSAPATNAFSPAPVIITAFTSSSSYAFCMASLISSRVLKFRALSFSTLLMMIIKIPSIRSTETFLNPGIIYLVTKQYYKIFAILFHNTVFREKESMARTVNYISIFLLLVAAAACKPNRIAATNRFENSRIILDKQECYGTCPVFTIEVNGTGKVIYEGKRFVKRRGKYEQQLQPEDARKLFHAFD